MLTYKAYRELKETDRWQRLENLGARPQRLLFASTGTKDPNASDVLYVEGLIAPNTINTMPEETLLAFADHGTVIAAAAPGRRRRRGGGGGVLAGRHRRRPSWPRTCRRTAAKAFVDSWQHLSDAVAAKRGSA